MADPITFIVTNAGKSALASGAVKLAYVALGSTKRVSSGSETALSNEVVRTPIISGGVEPISHVLRFSADTKTPNGHSIFEVGLITDRGILFAIASSNSTPFFSTSPTSNIATSFGMLLSESEAAGVSVISNASDNPALAVMESHLGDQYAHDQYLTVPRFQQLLDTMFPIGYFYHSEANPKALFDELLGVSTQWRRVTGKIIVATDANDSFIDSPQITLGIEGMTTEAISQRPQAYPLHTSHIWERI